jgi:hypothetical protein
MSDTPRILHYSLSMTSICPFNETYEGPCHMTLMSHDLDHVRFLHIILMYDTHVT